MVVDLVFQAGVALGIGARLALQHDRTSVGHDQAVPDQQRPRLTEGDLGVVLTDQSRTLGDQELSLIHISCLADGLTKDVIEPLSAGIVAWIKELAPAVDTRVVFKDSGFADDIAKTNMAAILNQNGISDVRSL